MSAKSPPLSGHGKQEVRHGAGYTLIEAMIAMAILAVIASLAYPTYSNYLERIDYSLVEKDFVEIDLKTEIYFVTNGAYPPDLATIGMQKDDPWGNPFQYLNMDLAQGNGQKRKDHNLVPINTDYDLFSMGPDGKSASPLTSANSQDDIIRANNGAYIGVASEY